MNRSGVISEVVKRIMDNAAPLFKGYLCLFPDLHDSICQVRVKSL